MNRRKSLSKEEAKGVFEGHINAAAKALAQVAKIVEDYTHHFDETAAGKAHLYLANQVQVLRNDLDAALRNNVVVKGGAFSLDAFAPPPSHSYNLTERDAFGIARDVGAGLPTHSGRPQVNVREVVAALAPEPDIDEDDEAALEALEGRSEVYEDEKTTLLPMYRRKPEGRLVGTKEVVFTDRLAAKTADPEPIDPRTVPDALTGEIKEAGFVDS